MKPLDLSYGNVDHGPSAGVVRRALSRMASEGDRYQPQQGRADLRTAIALKLRRVNRIQATAEQLVVTTGAAGALHATLSVLCAPGEACLIPDPGFPLYRAIAKQLGIQVLRYPLRADAGFEPDWGVLSALASNARVAIWNFPQNPTGAVAKPSWLERLSLLLTERPRLHLISDEVYDELVFSGVHPSPAAGLPRFQERIVSVFSFSKVHGMVGWRLGYAHADERLSSPIAAAHWATSMSAPTISQLVALGVLGTPASRQRRTLERLRVNRTLAVDGLARCGLQPILPEGGIYVWARLHRMNVDSTTFTEQCARDCRVLLSPGAAFAGNGAACVRVCFAVARADLLEALRRLEGWLRRRPTQRPSRPAPPLTPSLAGIRRGRVERRHAPHTASDPVS